MAQLNPNFEIDFSDINSYEQIQLINDTQLAKENLLMHRAYKEPSDDEIIRNHFSSFTFVDFCPKLFSRPQCSLGNQQQQQQLQPSSLSSSPTLSGVDLNTGSTNITGKGSSSARYYELETFSELFERINTWLKLNKDWRVVSMETLVYDCTSQFNQLKSSIYSAYLPQNTRGLRLFLSPSKSRFSGAQKIGCINVVPRLISGSHTEPDQQPVVYETLDDILSRLNELLLTRPIEGRILSVETITLPMVNGYVNTESNYFMDSRLNLLHESIYNLAAVDRAGELQTPDGGAVRGHSLVDILRVYYEFGPSSCGLVNLIDFLPRFYPSTVGVAAAESGGSGAAQDSSSPGGSASSPAPTSTFSERLMSEKICATESLTRLIRRSLAWFDDERKRTLSQQQMEEPALSSGASQVNLRLCNLQVRHKTLLKRQLTQVSPSNVLEVLKTRALAHERLTATSANLVCQLCSSSSVLEPAQDWCDHLADMSQPYQVKFVRLAYVIPVYSRRSMGPMRPLRAYQRRRRPAAGGTPTTSAAALLTAVTPDACASRELSSSSSSSGASSEPDLSVEGCAAPFPLDCCELASALTAASVADQDPVASEPDTPSRDEDPVATTSTSSETPVEAQYRAAMELIRATMRRHEQDEQAHLSTEVSHDTLNDSPIGQLTYRLFAPCQLVNSSSCFSINPVNSSSPLARRGSVDLNGTGLSSDNAHPSTLLLGPGGRSGGGAGELSQHVVTSFGAFFPALSQDLTTNSLVEQATGSTSSAASTSAGKESGAGKGQPGSRFTTNEFEPVEAIKRRMEIYVTTNSMKVVAGETLIVNLSDALSCLSTAIEQTLTKVPQLLGKRQARPSTWVSVYVLYATVQEAQLPDQLLAQQRLRELSLISEEPPSTSEDRLSGAEGVLSGDLPDPDTLFDDQFRSTPDVSRTSRSFAGDPGATLAQINTRQSEPTLTCATPSSSTALSATITLSARQTEPSLTLYNSAYDRTVALPTLPE